MLLSTGNFSNATAVTNAGTWSLQGDIGLALNPNYIHSSATFANTGTLVKSAGTGSSVIGGGLAFGGGVAFANSGTLNAQTGTIDYQTANPTFNSGTVFASSGKHLLSNGGIFNSDFTFTDNLQFAGGVFNGVAPGGVTPNGNLLWTGGVLIGNWNNGIGHTVTTNTPGVSMGIGNFSNDTAVTNAGTWNLQGDIGLALNPNYVHSSATFTNTGTLVKSAGTGSSVIGDGVIFANSGTLNAQTGTIDYQTANPTFNSGTVFAGSGKHLLSNGGVFNSDFTFTDNLQLAGGVFNGVAPGGVTPNGNLLWTGGVLIGNWNNGVGHTLTANTTDYKVFGGTFTNQGTVSQQDTSLLLSIGNFNHDTAVTNVGTWNLQEDIGLALNPNYVHSSATFTNTGTLVKSAGTGSSVIGDGVAFANSGTVDVKAGTIQIAQSYNNQGNIHVSDGAAFGVTGANFSNDTSGLISGQGTIDPLNTLINSGVIKPGENGLGTLHVAGNYQQSSTGILDIGIGGSDNLGVLNIQGDATWGGTLKVTSLGGFMPTIDELFTVALFSGTFTGQFASLDTSAFSGVTFSTLYDSHDVTLKVIAVNAVPLPPALWLFGSALVGISVTGFRKKHAQSQLIAPVH